MSTCFKQNSSQPAWDFPLKAISLLPKSDWRQPNVIYTNAFCFSNAYTTELAQAIVNGSDLQLFMMDKPFLPFAQVTLPKQSALTEADFLSNTHLFLNFQ